MKKLVLFISSVLVATGLSAQDIHPIVQERLSLEEVEFTADEEVEDKEEITVEYMYHGETRDGSTDTIYCYRWDRQNEAWVNHSRSVKVFDENEKILEHTFQFWGDDATWKNGIHEVYYYNDAGKLSEKISQIWHIRLQEWVNHFRKQISYNDFLKPIEINMQHWKPDFNNWVNRHQKVMAYNDAQVLVADTVKTWLRDIEIWSSVILNKYFYSDAGEVTAKVLLKKRPHPLAQWHKIKRNLFNYNDFGLLTGVKTEVWNNLFDVWINKYRVMLHYNDAGQLINKTHQFWYQPINIWMNSKKEMIGYNDAGLKDHVVYQKWNRLNSVWLNRSSIHFEYDDGGSIIEKLLQVWAVDADMWVNFRKWVVTIQYKNAAADLTQPGEKYDVRLIYQNPYLFGSTISVSGLSDRQAVLDVFDLNGKMVSTSICNDQSSVRINSNLKPGIYILNLHTNGEVLFNGKMIILK